MFETAQESILLDEEIIAAVKIWHWKAIKKDGNKSFSGPFEGSEEGFYYLNYPFDN